MLSLSSTTDETQQAGLSRNRHPNEERLPGPAGTIDLLPVIENVQRVVSRVWPLQDYVAVNPYQGLVGRDWLSARRFLKVFSRADTLMPLDYFQKAFRAGRFTRADLETAIDDFLRDGVKGADRLSAQALARLLQGETPTSRELSSDPPVQAITALIDEGSQTSWTETITSEVGRLCAAHYDQGQARWHCPWSGMPLYAAWKKIAGIDRSMEIRGMRGFRDFVRDLPEDPLLSLAAGLHQLQIPKGLWEYYLLALVFTVPGWFSWVQYRDQQAKQSSQDGGDFLGLLAIRLNYDVAALRFLGTPTDLQMLQSDWRSTLHNLEKGDRPDQQQGLERYCLLRAIEVAYRRQLLNKMEKSRQASADASTQSSEARRKRFQMVFCIDVRSEPFRRALETCSGELETLGFAGFFGVPMEYVAGEEGSGRNQLPVLFEPAFRVREEPRAESSRVIDRERARRQAQRLRSQVAADYRSSTWNSLAAVETTGWWYGWKLLSRSFRNWSKWPKLRNRNPNRPADIWGPGFQGLEEQGLGGPQLADLAAGILRNMGLQNYARLVVLAGHASCTVNNPLRAGLDCGACGGHSGEANARFAAKLLNDPAIRSALASRGLNLPDDTWFLPALHDTTTDTLEVFDQQLVPAAHQKDLQELQAIARQAQVINQKSRAAELGSEHASDLSRRSQDWSETRPEWGLAGNAAFIVGGRDLTKYSEFDGRTFLHDYDYRKDTSGATLELIMTAPMIVTHWINMQYYASAVDPDRFGSGTKTIHNVVGRFGILAGGKGDLQTGLPNQSLHDGQTWQHEPIRLQVVIAAPRARVLAIIEKHESVRNLVANGWLHLVVLEEGRYFRMGQRLAWFPLNVESGHSPGNRDSVAGKNRTRQERGTTECGGLQNQSFTQVQEKH